MQGYALHAKDDCRHKAANHEKTQDEAAGIAKKYYRKYG
jgi:hypothetical protein